MSHASTSTEHQGAESILLSEAAKVLGVKFLSKHPAALRVLKLDGYVDGERPVCVEVFAHVGPSKSGQQRKLSRDMAKLLLAERLLKKECRKVLVVADPASIRHFEAGWDGTFAREFGIEQLPVPIDADLRAALERAQKRQRR